MPRATAQNREPPSLAQLREVAAASTVAPTAGHPTTEGLWAKVSDPGMWPPKVLCGVIL